VIITCGHDDGGGAALTGHSIILNVQYSIMLIKSKQSKWKIQISLQMSVSLMSVIGIIITPKGISTRTLSALMTERIEIFMQAKLHHVAMIT
jgi:aspartokinase